MSEPHGDSRQTTREEDQKTAATRIRDLVSELNKSILRASEIGVETELDITDITSIDAGRVTGVVTTIRVRI